VALGRGVKPGQGSGVLAELYKALGRGIKYFDRQAGRQVGRQGRRLRYCGRQAGPSIKVFQKAGGAVD
jgi:hypothetical protein